MPSTAYCFTPTLPSALLQPYGSRSSGCFLRLGLRSRLPLVQLFITRSYALRTVRSSTFGLPPGFTWILRALLPFFLLGYRGSRFAVVPRLFGLVHYLPVLTSSSSRLRGFPRFPPAPVAYLVLHRFWHSIPVHYLHTVCATRLHSPLYYSFWFPCCCLHVCYAHTFTGCYSLGSLPATTQFSVLLRLRSAGYGYLDWLYMPTYTTWFTYTTRLRTAFHCYGLVLVRWVRFGSRFWFCVALILHQPHLEETFNQFTTARFFAPRCVYAFFAAHAKENAGCLYLVCAVGSSVIATLFGYRLVRSFYPSSLPVQFPAFCRS